ncbi:MAG TPA: ClbS/DfsB family four-helix bundle protein [Ktedonobacterales bacterium]|nr:ClbS/DfsB family four-helix bundle protein [Ktedonobacterales bacterium]
MANDQVRARLVELLNDLRAEQQTFLAALNEAERDATGTADSWAVKDVFAHITTWKARSAERLRYAARGETPPDTRDFETFNARDFEEHREQSWAAVQTDEARVHDELLAAVRQLSDDTLADPSRFAWMNGEPLCVTVLSNGVWHPQDHLVKLWLARGAMERAQRIQDRVAAALTQSGLPDAVRGMAIYNLACVYATTGQPQQALAALPEGLRLHPRLVVDARTDPDFTSLRDLPAFQALVAE